MRFSHTLARLRLFTAALAAVSVAACGGGGGGGGSTNPPPNNGTTITLTVSGSAPSAAAERIGGGSWSALSMSGSTGSFVLPSGTSTYGVAIVCQSVYEVIELLSVNDTKNPTILCPALGNVSTSVNYDVSSILNAHSAEVYIGTASAYPSGVTGTATFTSAPSGTQDVAVVAYASGGTDAIAAKIVRGVNVTTSPIGPVTAVQGVDNTSSASLSLSGVPAGYGTQVNASYLTAGGAQLTIKNGGSTSSYPTIASADSAGGDSYYVQAFASLSNATLTTQVGTAQTFSTPKNLSLAFPTPMNVTAPSPAQYPTFTVPTYSGFNVSGNLAYQFGAFAPMQNYILVGTTSAYLATVGNSLAFPNLSGISGFLSEPGAGHPEDWFVQESISPTANYLFETPFPNNASMEYALVSGQFTVP